MGWECIKTKNNTYNNKKSMWKTHAFFVLKKGLISLNINHGLNQTES